MKAAVTNALQLGLKAKTLQDVRKKPLPCQHNHKTCMFTSSCSIGYAAAGLKEPFYKHFIS